MHCTAFSSWTLRFRRCLGWVFWVQGAGVGKGLLRPTVFLLFVVNIMSVCILILMTRITTLTVTSFRCLS